MKSVRMTNLRNLFGVGVLNRWQRALAVVLVCAATTTTVPAQVVVTFKNLANFDLTNGEEPNGLAQGVDGNFYGTTDLGGANSCNCGVIFKITPGGNLSALHSFTGAGEGADGGYPGAGLTLGPDGNFYGTTSSGGPNEGGTVFQFNPSTKAVTVLWSFPNANGDGEYPEGALALGSDG
ncbi:MAG TPA: choice-of-anchor tandem repeat GloVer-containing protein, partial [Terriglobales bacterium]|nr:choice-of-anchor tandem repeat GloVer-containing protein [Terriglobales bacterium]